MLVFNTSESRNLFTRSIGDEHYYNVEQASFRSAQCLKNTVNENSGFRGLAINKASSPPVGNTGYHFQLEQEK